MIGTGGMRCRGAGRSIEADFGLEHAGTFRRDLHPDLRADYVLASARARAHSTAMLTRRACRRQDNHMPFNDSDWFREDDDVRWQYGVPLAPA
jgi:type I restriction enzyme M protein